MKTFITTAFCILNLLCYAQKNYQKGYVITNASDTIQGFINYQEWGNNPKSILFKKDDNSNIQTFTISNIQYFEITGIESYQRYVCSISMDYRDLRHLSGGVDSSRKVDTVFLQLVSSGNNLQLFRYQDEVKYRFYVKGQNDEVPQELLFQVYLNPDNLTTLSEIKTYQNQLTVYAGMSGIDINKFSNKVSKIGYYQDDIVKLVRLINNGKENKPETVKRKKYSRFFVSAGLNKASLTMKGNQNSLPTKLSFSDSFTPVFAAGIDFFSNPNIGRLLLRNELSLFNTNYHGYYKYPSDYATNEYYYRLKQNVLSLSLSLMYHFYNKEALKVFIGGGVGFHYYRNAENRFYSKSPDQTYNMDPLDFSSFALFGSLRTGVAFRKNIEVSFVISKPDYLTDYSYYFDKTFDQQLRITYLFKTRFRHHS